MKTFLANLGHLITHDLAADHARVTSAATLDQAFAAARIKTLESQVKVLEARIKDLEASLATNATQVLKAKKAK